jgi:DNA-binding Xre family transcriptional regulator
MTGKLDFAWSNLGLLLAERNMSVLALHQNLAATGVRANLKSLNRLVSSDPLQKIDLRLVKGICAILDIKLGDLIQLSKPVHQLRNVDPDTQTRISLLLDKRNQGTSTKEEDAELSDLIEGAQKVSLYNAKVLAEYKRSRGSSSVSADPDASVKIRRTKKPVQKVQDVNARLLSLPREQKKIEEFVSTLFPPGTETRGLKCNTLANAILALQFAGEPVTVESIERLLRSAPAEERSLKSAEWREASWCYQLLDRKVSGLKVQGANYNSVVHYWLDIFPEVIGPDRECLAEEITKAIK